LKEEDKFGLSHLPESVIHIVTTALKKVDKGEELFSTLDLINEIKLHRDY